mmetsp:Transcript_13314/g.16840  ORF Transcript_13314/g.16840 Transcript_13314/m.16840 type:complete len:82 (-) Transcript_13314:34-279(-)
MLEMSIINLTRELIDGDGQSTVMSLKFHIGKSCFNSMKKIKVMMSIDEEQVTSQKAKKNKYQYRHPNMTGIGRKHSRNDIM